MKHHKNSLSLKQLTLPFLQIQRDTKTFHVLVGATLLNPLHFESLGHGKEGRMDSKTEEWGACLWNFRCVWSELKDVKSYWLGGLARLGWFCFANTTRPWWPELRKETGAWACFGSCSVVSQIEVQNRSMVKLLSKLPWWFHLKHAKAFETLAASIAEVQPLSTEAHRRGGVNCWVQAGL